MDRCANCNEPVIKRADGRVLDIKPSTLGIHLPEGGTLTAAEFRKSHYAGTPRGHVAHHCNRAEQQALFDLVLPPQPARRKR